METLSMFTVITHEGVKLPVWAEGAASNPPELVVPLIAKKHMVDAGIMVGESFGLPPARAIAMLKSGGAALDPRAATMVDDPLKEPMPEDAPVGAPMVEEPAPVKRGRSSGRNAG